MGNILGSNIKKVGTGYIRIVVMILGLFFRSAVGYANETPWHLNYLLMIRDSTASIYETGENNWVSQMSGGGFLGLSFQRDISFLSSEKGFGWDIATNLYWDPLLYQSVPSAQEDQFDYAGPQVNTKHRLEKIDLEVFSRLFYSLYAGTTIKIVAPFVGFGGSRSSIHGDPYVTHSSNISAECRQGVEGENADLIKSSCYTIPISGSVLYGIKRAGILFRIFDGSSSVNMIFARQSPVYFEISGVRVRYEAKYIYGFEWEF